MQEYSYTLALRFWHPSIDPTTITDELGISPTHSWEAGKPRVTPKGTQLDGVNRESYWSAHPSWQGWRNAQEIQAEDAILELLPRLSPHRAFIQQILISGGRGMIQISSHGTGNYALVLPPELLAQCSELGLSFAHDVYPVE